jgi:hypothetical protein
VVFCFYSTQSLNPCSSGGSYCYYSPLSLSRFHSYTHILGRWLLKLLLSTAKRPVMGVSFHVNSRSLVFHINSLSLNTLSLVPPYVRYPLPSEENRHIPERDDLGPPVVPEGQEINLGSRTLPKGGGTSHGACRL